jgi:hypothetical protein
MSNNAPRFSISRTGYYNPALKTSIISSPHHILNLLTFDELEDERCQILSAQMEISDKEQKLANLSRRITSFQLSVCHLLATSTSSIRPNTRQGAFR